MESTDNSHQARINNTKIFLKEHPDEEVACAATIFGLARSTLRSSITKDKRPVSTVINGGQNKILEPYQITAIHGFIQSLLVHGIQPSKGVVFNAIVTLKRAQNSDGKPPTMQWFRGW